MVFAHRRVLYCISVCLFRHMIKSKNSRVGSAGIKGLRSVALDSSDALLGFSLGI